MWTSCICIGQGAAVCLFGRSKSQRVIPTHTRTCSEWSLAIFSLPLIGSFFSLHCCLEHGVLAIGSCMLFHLVFAGPCVELAIFTSLPVMEAHLLEQYWERQHEPHCWWFAYLASDLGSSGVFLHCFIGLWGLILGITGETLLGKQHGHLERAGCIKVSQLLWKNTTYSWVWFVFSSRWLGSWVLGLVASNILVLAVAIWGVRIWWN